MNLDKEQQLKMMNEGQRYIAGKFIAFYDASRVNPWRFKAYNEQDSESSALDAPWGWKDWQPLEEPAPPKMRQMTREEILAFIALHGNKIMVRRMDSWQFPEYYDYDYEDVLGSYEYCYFTIEKGSMVFGEAYNFLVEEGE